jgi:hypothetical protein
MVGKTYSNWKVLEHSETRGKKIYYLCECLLCKTQHVVHGGNIRSGKSKQCLDCARKIVALAKKGVPRTEEVKKKVSESHKGKKLSEEHKSKLRGFDINQNNPFYLNLDPTPSLLNRGTRLSHVAGYKFNKIKKIKLGYDLTKYDVAEIICKQCQYCGHVPDLSDTNNNSPYNGIDRIDSSRGYFKDNVVPCCKTCNFAKNEMTVFQFKRWVEKISSYQKKQG